MMWVVGKHVEFDLLVMFQNISSHEVEPFI